MVPMRNSVLKIDQGTCLFFACMLLLVPLKLVLAWFLAIFVHELWHYIALKACGAKIRSVSMGISGVLMDTGPIGTWKELVCSVAGPLGGFSLLLVARWLPRTAIFAFLHSGYNLMPIFPLDGGRALRCVLIKLFGSKDGEKLSEVVSRVVIVLLSLVSIYLSWKFHFAALAICFIGSVLILRWRRKFPCKLSKEIVQ